MTSVDDGQVCCLNDLVSVPFQVRSGLSYVEERNETLTNPVWKTSGVNGLSPAGRRQVSGPLITPSGPAEIRVES